MVFQPAYSDKARNC